MPLPVRSTAPTLTHPHTSEKDIVKVGIEVRKVGIVWHSLGFGIAVSAHVFLGDDEDLLCFLRSMLR